MTDVPSIYLDCGKPPVLRHTSACFVLPSYLIFFFFPFYLPLVTDRQGPFSTWARVLPWLTSSVRHTKHDAILKVAMHVVYGRGTLTQERCI